MVSRVFLLTIGFLSGFLSYGLISLLGVIAMEFTPSAFSGSSHAIAGRELFWKFFVFSNKINIFFFIKAFAAGLGMTSAGLPFSTLSYYFNWSGAFQIVEFLTIFVIVFLFLFRNSKSKFEIESFSETIERKNQ